MLRSALRKLPKRWVQKSLAEARRDQETFEEFQTKVLEKIELVQVVGDKSADGVDKKKTTGDTRTCLFP